MVLRRPATPAARLLPLRLPERLDAIPRLAVDQGRVVLGDDLALEPHVAEVRDLIEHVEDDSRAELRPAPRPLAGGVERLRDAVDADALEVEVEDPADDAGLVRVDDEPPVVSRLRLAADAAVAERRRPRDDPARARGLGQAEPGALADLFALLLRDGGAHGVDQRRFGLPLRGGDEPDAGGFEHAARAQQLLGVAPKPVVLPGVERVEPARGCVGKHPLVLRLQETVYQFEQVHGVVVRIDRDPGQLAEALAGEQARIIVTTLQKFPYVLDEIEALPARRYGVVVDEAHSSQTGEAAADLRRALSLEAAEAEESAGEAERGDGQDALARSLAGRGRPGNLPFFAFTATPKAKTLELFGTPVGTGEQRRSHPFHLYSMRQAIAPRSPLRSDTSIAVLRLTRVPEDGTFAGGVLRGREGNVRLVLRLGAVRLGLVRLGLAALIMALVAGTASRSFAVPAASGPCTEATARQLIAEHDLNSFQLQDPVLQLLCGPFTGPGSQAMAIVVGPLPTCWPSQEWAVFSLIGGEWKLVLEQTRFLNPPLVVVGSDIQETRPIFRPGDSRCIPTGGTHARLWHWNGTRFVAGPWKQVKAPDPITRAEIFSPSRNLACQMIDQASAGTSSVVCLSYKPQHWVRLALNGRLHICPRGPRCTGNWGEGTHFRMLAYGRQITVGRFRCFSLSSGVKCVVIRSGKGFLIDRVGIRKVG